MPYTFLHCIKETITKMMCGSVFDTWKKLWTNSKTCRKKHKDYSRTNKTAVWCENQGAQGFLVLFIKKMDKRQLDHSFKAGHFC